MFLFFCLLLALITILTLFFNLQSNYDQTCDAFDDMNLREDLLRGIYAYGFEKPSAIQQRAILPCIGGEILSIILNFNVSKNRSNFSTFFMEVEKF